MIEVLGSEAALAVAAELRDVYLSAFGAPGYDESAEKADQFAAEQLPTHAARPGFKLVVTRAAGGAVTGFAYGFTGDRGQWWPDRIAEVAPEIATSGSAATSSSSNWPLPRQPNATAWVPSSTTR